MRLNKESVMNVINQEISISTIRMKHRTKVHVAIIMKRGKVMEVAGNMAKGCGHHAWSVHAERAVLKKVGDVTKLDGAILIVVRVANGTGELVNSKPCLSCQPHLKKCMKEYGLRCVYYS